jgi:hypothetical protein
MTESELLHDDDVKLYADEATWNVAYEQHQSGKDVWNI